MLEAAFERGAMFERLRNRRGQVLALLALAFVAGGCTKEFRKNRHLKRADAYFDEKKYKEAILEYRNVLRFVLPEVPNKDPKASPTPVAVAASSPDPKAPPPMMDSEPPAQGWKRAPDP